MLTIPLSNKNQDLKVVLSSQVCRIIIYQNSTGMYLDLYVNGILIRESVLCLNKQPMITESYLGFIGKLMFEDTHGNLDPEISQLGTRFKLRYLL